MRLMIGAPRGGGVQEYALARGEGGFPGGFPMRAFSSMWINTPFSPREGHFLCLWGLFLRMGGGGGGGGRFWAGLP